MTDSDHSSNPDCRATEHDEAVDADGEDEMSH